jgi:Short C-terminal domain
VGLFKKKPPVDAEITVHNETIDATNMGDLREEILDTLKEHGIEPGQPQVINASEIPGMTEEIMGALNKAGVWQQAFAGLGAATPEHDDPVDQLAKLAELHKKGVLSDYEFAVAKQKLLGENWDS